MFKNMKLGTKIISGFSIILILAAVVGFFGYNGLGQVTTIVDKADDANRLIKLAKDCRLQEKNFIMRGDKKYQQENDNTVTEIHAQITATMAKLKDPADKEMLQKVETAAKAYKKNFDGWITLWEKQQVQEKGMLDNARMFIRKVESMASGRRAGSVTIPNENAEKETVEIWRTDAANRLIQMARDCRIQEKNFLLRGDKKYQEENDNTMNQIYALCNEWARKYSSQSDKEEVAEVKTAAREYKKNFDGWIVLWDKQQSAVKKMVDNAREFNRFCEELRAGQKIKMQATSARSNTVMISATLLAVAAGLVLAFFITRGITTALNRIIEGLSEGAEQVASASSQVSSASQSLAEGSSEQAASIEETSASLEEMSSMTSQNADNAGQADNLMKSANKVVDQANESMTELTESMAEISKASEETSKIIKTIDEIAFQTNLLALNAAVEAARAGEAGAGFAVVADEVRNLAMRAADAARNTSDLIEGTVSKVSDGSVLVARTNEAFTQVAESTAKVDDLVAEIAAASSEQAQGIGQVNIAVTEMDKVTQQNAANAEESASASEEMNAQAEQMKAMVGDLLALVKGGTTQTSTVADAKTLGHKKHRVLALPGRSAEVAARQSAGSSPEQMIPLDNENDFDDF